MDMQVTKRIEFECCYIYNSQLEAHRCKLEVTVEGPQRFQDFGQVISYERLSQYLQDVVPHKTFLYHTADPDGVTVGRAFKSVGCFIQEFLFPISAENLCKYFVKELQLIFDANEPGITVVDMKLREDNNSFVSWHKDMKQIR